MKEKKTFGQWAKEQVKKGYTFVKEHKGVIIGTISGIVVGSVTVLIALGNRELDEDDDPSYGINECDDPSYAIDECEGISTTKQIDEDIFTRIAPNLEMAIIDPGIEKYTDTEYYRIAPDINKEVTISMDTIYGD